MPPLPSKDSVIRRKPFYKPPKPGSEDAIKGYPTINPFPLLEDKKSVNKSNKNKQRSLNTDMSRLARKNYRKKKKKNTRKVVKAKPAGPNPQGERVEVSLVSASLKKRKSKKRRSKRRKSKRRKSKRRN